MSNFYNVLTEKRTIKYELNFSFTFQILKDY
jgi:hypothetical protein